MDDMTPIDWFVMIIGLCFLVAGVAAAAHSPSGLSFGVLVGGFGAWLAWTACRNV